MSRPPANPRALAAGPRRRRAAALLGVAALIAVAASGQPRPLVWPQPADVGLLALDVRELAQRATLPEFDVVHDFTFVDRREESGIRFQHAITEDGGKTFKAVHYDHGSGILAGYFDGDDKLDVFFASQLGGNELWRNAGGGRFENITDVSGLGFEDNVFVTASAADIDNDGDPDLYVTTVRTGNHLLLNDGNGRFEDVTEGSGLGYVGHSSSPMFFDYDNDGLLDLFLVNVGNYTHEEKGPGGFYRGRQDAFLGHNYPERTEASILFRNLGSGRFEDVSSATGLVETGWNGDATFTDLNGDRYPDVYVLNMQGDDHYWENQGGKRFVEKTAEHFPKSPWGAMGVKFFDWNNDGLLDLMLTDMHSDMSREVLPGYEKLKSFMVWTEDDYLTDGAANNVFGNAFWENRGGGSFVEVSDEVNAENYWPWGITVADLNADGWQDVFVCASMSFPFRYGINTVLLNNRGERFLDSEFILGIEPRAGERYKKPEFELDCQGADREHRMCRSAWVRPMILGDLVQKQPSRYLVMGSVGTRSAVIFDLDEDGDLDIVTNEMNDRPQVLVSNLAQRSEVSYLLVDLTGTRSNRDGLGAWVTVHVGDRVLTKYHDGKTGYLSQSASQPLYFGLGDADSVDRIEVVWPSGVEQTVRRRDVTLNSKIEIIEPRHAVSKLTLERALASLSGLR